MRKDRLWIVTILVIILSLAGCNTKPQLSYLEIVSPDSTSLTAVSNIEIKQNTFATNSMNPLTLEIIAKDDHGLKMKVDAEWAAEGGYVTQTFNYKTEYIPWKRGKYIVGAKVGEYTATATINVYGRIGFYSGGDDPRNAIGLGDENYVDKNNADIVFLNNFRPDSPNYAESNKCVFPFGFLPLQFNDLSAVNQVPESTPDQWVSCVEIPLGQEGNYTFSGIVKTKIGYAKAIISTTGVNHSGETPLGYEGSIYYLDSQTTQFEY